MTDEARTMLVPAAECSSNIALGMAIGAETGLEILALLGLSALVVNVIGYRTLTGKED